LTQLERRPPKKMEDDLQKKMEDDLKKNKKMEDDLKKNKNKLGLSCAKLRSSWAGYASYNQKEIKGLLMTIRKKELIWSST
jgi:hypothetical protein